MRVHYKMKLKTISVNGGNSMADMVYRKLPHAGEEISVIGLGIGSIHESAEDEIEDTVRFAWKTA